MERNASAIVQRVLGGKEEIVCHGGTHQYGGSGRGITGVSACGLAALNFARIVFEKEQESTRDEHFIQAVIGSQTVHDITDICAGWSSNLHLDVDDICRVPLFEHTLKLVSTKYGRPGLDEFTNLLRELQAIRTSAVAIITRPPEIIACLKLVINNRDIFVIFDSHPRPSYPDGAGLILNASIHGTVHRLNQMLPVDSSLLSDGSLQWQAQLLANYSGHIFISRGLDNSPAHLMQSVVESSLAVLALRARVSDLESRISSLTSENQRLEAEMEHMEEEHRKEQKRILQSSRNQGPQSYSPSDFAFAQIDNAGAGSQVALHHCNRPSANSHLKDKSFQSYMSPSSSNDNQRFPLNQDGDLALAEQMQLEWLDSDRQSTEAAAQRQRQFDEEDRLLRAQRAELANHTQPHFQCGVCLEEEPEDYVARIDPCGHCFCRDCIRGYVGSKLDENRYPILCPVCMAEEAKGDPSVVTSILVQQIGISEKQYETWIELQMVEFSVLLHCCKCKQSAFVDRHDLEDTKTLACPFPECSYIWCKACQQPIALGGPQHSCDGSSELDHLMKERGWKYCPGCKTPIQKDTGCNHMTCMSPGCNTHFCYICGEAIIRSALRRDVEVATTAHYRRCKLFEDVADIAGL